MVIDKIYGVVTTAGGSTFTDIHVYGGVYEVRNE